MTSVEEAWALSEQRLRAWRAEDLDTYLSFWADDVTFQAPVPTEPLHGKAAYRELLENSAQLIKPISFDVRYIAVSGDALLSEWRCELEWRHDGRRSAWDGMSSYELQDGLITHWREYWNPNDLTPA